MVKSIVDKVITHIRISPSDNLNFWNTLVGQLTPDERDYVLQLLQIRIKIFDMPHKRNLKRI